MLITMADTDKKQLLGRIRKRVTSTIILSYES